MAQVILYAALAALGIACVIAAGLAFTRRWTPFARTLLLALIVVEILLAVANHVTRDDADYDSFFNWLFDLNTEMTLGTIFSAAQYMAVAGVGLVIALFAEFPRRWQRCYWYFLAGLMAYFSLDEFYSIHEWITPFTKYDLWRIPYGIAGGLLVLLTVWVFWQNGRRDARFYALLFVGLFVMGLGGIALERIIWNANCPEGMDSCWDRLLIVEETSETVGVTIVLASFLLFAEQYVRRERWRVVKLGFIIGGTVCGLWLIFSVFFQPAVEAHFFARPVSAEFGDGAVSLIGYNLSQDVVKPGDVVAVTFYWRANRFISRNYRLTLNLLSHPDVQALVRTENLHMGDIPTRAWLPGMVIRREIKLDMPQDLRLFASYWLMVRIWQGAWGHPRGIPIDSTDRMQIAPDTLILDTLSAVDSIPQPTLATAANYRFADEFTLTGYTLPERGVVGKTLPLGFAWSVQAWIPRNYTVFLHLVPADGGDLYTFDRQPFNDSFPTGDWVVGMNAVDSWSIDLPADMPLGEYNVYMGMYAPETMERAPVVDGNDQPVRDNRIRLGAITLKAE